MSYGSKLRYHLVGQEDGNKFVPRTISNNLIDTDGLMERIANTTIRYNKNELLYILAEIKKHIEYSLLQGEAVMIDGLLTMRPQVSGNFDDYNERFNHKKHKVKLSITAYSNLDERVNAALGVKKVHVPDKREVIDRNQYS